MPNKTMIIFSGFLVLVLVAGGRTKAEDCSTTPGTTCPTITDDVTSHTPKPPAQPKALNMLAEDSMEGVFQPTPLPASQTKRATNATEEPKGRALNFTVAEHTTGNVLHANASHDQFGDLSDVSITDEEGQEDMEKMMDTKDAKANTTLGICEKGGLTYEDGEKLEIGCDSICTCSKGKMDCTDHCTGPYFRRGKKLEDPLCTAKDSDDPCCSVMVCSSDTETEPIEMCSFANHTIHRGQTFNKSCDEVCICEKAGKLLCKPRCPPSNKTSDRCVELPDPNDSCCKKVLCDVTLDDHDEDKPKIKILSAIFVNDTTIKLEFDGKFDDNLPIIDVSEDNSTWSSYQLSPDNYLTIKPPAKFVKLDNSIEPITINTKPITEKTKPSEGCDYKGQTFKEGEEHNDNCESLCVCKKGQMKCLKLECPTYFGVDVLDPNCLDWETVPADFKPKAPHCCADQIRCKNNGSCVHEGRMYRNWEQLPINITGCEKRCYCEMGNVECQNACPPVEALPPPHLGCPAHEAVIKQLDKEDCCKGWQCEHKGFEGNAFNPFQQPGQDELVVQTLQALDSHTIRLAFIIPSVFVGLHGRVEVKYTNEKTDNIDAWKSQIFAPQNDLIATPQLEFELLGLEPDTEYKIKIIIMLRDIRNTPKSKVYKIRTLPAVIATTLPPMIPIGPDLSITDINSTWVTVVWRKFIDYELQFIDGIQLRYKEIDGKIYAATPLIHRAVTSYTLENLKPNTKYEVGIFFIPFPGQLTELHAENMLHFTTANEVDTYGFNVSLDISQIKSTSVTITWSGVPYPEDKYVNIFRAIYQSDSGKEDRNTFKLAKRDSPTKTIIMDLKPGTRYRLWLEVYLTNGKIKTSNVQDFITKPRPAPSLSSSSQQDKLSGTEDSTPKGDYYGPLVIVAILAAIAILSTLVLLLILVRRHNQNKASITPPSTRVSQSAYDNPTYKVEIQQETMGL